MPGRLCASSRPPRSASPPRARARRGSPRWRPEQASPAPGWRWTDLLKKANRQQRQIAQPILAHWRNDADLASVRDKKELESLPPAERDGWRKFWADVDELLRTIDTTR